MAKDYHIKLHSRYFGGKLKVAHHSPGQLQTLCFFSWSGYSVSFLQALLFLTIFSTRPSAHPYSIAHTHIHRNTSAGFVWVMVLSPPALLRPDTDGHFLPSCTVLCWARRQNVLPQYEWVQSLNTHCFSLSPSFCLSLFLCPTDWCHTIRANCLHASYPSGLARSCVCASLWRVEGEKKREELREGTASMTMQSGPRGKEIDRRTDRERETMGKIHCFPLNVLGNRGCRNPCQ